MSGHGVTLYPSGAYFDGQGYYFDGSDDYLIDAGGRKILTQHTKGTWHSLYFTNGEVPSEGTVTGTGTKIGINLFGIGPLLTGKIVLYPQYCPNIIYFNCRRNRFSVVDASRMTKLETFDCYDNYNISVLDVSALTNLKFFGCQNNKISLLDVSALTKLSIFHCHNNLMNQDMVDTVLCDVDSHGTSGGDLNISGNAEPSDLYGKPCRDRLADRGWNVTTD